MNLNLNLNYTLDGKVKHEALPNLETATGLAFQNCVRRWFGFWGSTRATYIFETPVV